jgi:hypothetical protein
VNGKQEGLRWLDERQDVAMNVAKMKEKSLHALVARYNILCRDAGPQCLWQVA